MLPHSTILVTGAAGFIGSALVRQWLSETRWNIVGVDALTYAAVPDSLAGLAGEPRFSLHVADVTDPASIERIFAVVSPDAVVHLAAESHVDQSITQPRAFVLTNVVGTQCLLDVSLRHWRSLPEPRRAAFRFLQVSTDEVFGPLGPYDQPFGIDAPYRPSSPYSASKAGADHLIRAWHRTYGLPTLTAHVCNNYGPRQFPEKLIPLMIHRAMTSSPMPIYGDGSQRREWLHVDDHALALKVLVEHGEPGGIYTVGSGEERTNLEVVTHICSILDQLNPLGAPHHRGMAFVEDRPGHDFRYALACSALASKHRWRPRYTFDEGLHSTVHWYVSNPEWMTQALQRTSRPSGPPLSIPLRSGASDRVREDSCGGNE